MGWYLRKSLRLGPLRINLSKSGLGGSLGVKGLRIGTGPRGRYLHAGREGLYYRTSLDGAATGSGAPRKPPETTPEIEAREIAPGTTGSPATPIAGTADDPARNQLGMRLLRSLFGRLLRR